MNREISDKVGVLIHNFQLLTGVIVVDTNLCVISANYNPLFSRDEFRASHRRIGDLKRSHL